ncbi:MAG: putative sulfate/molybdate transporter [Cyclobacteriaceae bacterium]|nr:putative sulfate/molybdate transporter [Cyclobacteriaceae bacterium]
MKLHQIKFNRAELGGAFGDIGTDFPLIVAMILAAGLHTPSVLIVFGLMQIFTGLVYRMPMPVQPLKAMATIVISQKIAGTILLGAGLAIGVVMLILSLTGLLDKLARWVPKAVVRGIQFGLGLSLCLLAFKEYIPANGLSGFIIAAIAFVLIIILIDNRQYPASLIVILLGIVYAVLTKLNLHDLAQSVGFTVPQVHAPSIDDITKGFLLLALPQIPLSLGNSILATKQVAQDLFPERTDLTIRKIGITYSIMNLAAPWVSGIPCCHGAGGMMGHYTFGGRTGGSVILYGMLFIVLGVFLGDSVHQLIEVFPLPILGIILLFEGAALLLLIRDLAQDKKGLVVALLTGLLAFGLPYGFLVGIIAGLLLHYLPVNLNTLKEIGDQKEKNS